MKIDRPNSPYSLITTLNTKNNEYFGFYRGIVLDNEDPEERGRCKVYVQGVHSESCKGGDRGTRLPWAEPSQPLFGGGRGEDGDNGTFQCPDLNSTVWVFFESGDINHPVMFGQTTDANGKFSTKHCTIKWEKMKIDLHREDDVNTITIEADTDVNIKTGNKVNIIAKSDVNVQSGSSINMEATSSVNVKAPAINLNGALSVNGTAYISSATTIDAATTISADATIGGKSFLGHMHLGNFGAPTSPPL